jgi:hypothetical protein
VRLWVVLDWQLALALAASSSACPAFPVPASPGAWLALPAGLATIIRAASSAAERRQCGVGWPGPFRRWGIIHATAKTKAKTNRSAHYFTQTPPYNNYYVFPRLPPFLCLFLISGPASRSNASSGKKFFRDLLTQIKRKKECLVGVREYFKHRSAGFLLETLTRRSFPAGSAVIRIDPIAYACLAYTTVCCEPCIQSSQNVPRRRSTQ